MIKGIIFFNDGCSMEYQIDEMIYTDNGIITIAKEGKTFIPYGSIKMITEK